jgi:dihydropteroate synthase
MIILRAGQRQFTFPRPTLLMGIVNVTPDSFSDGGQFLEVNAAVEQALRLVEEGAEILDIGGESTRPNAVPVSAAEELRRVMPVFEALRGRTEALISIDTYKPEVAREAILAGASMVNDVGASGQHPAMWAVLAESQAAYVAMHMRGTPQTMQLNPVYEDVRRAVGTFFADCMGALSGAGVNSERVVLDVGIGFGKTRAHNLELLAGLDDFAQFERPVLVGVSRKSFLGPGQVPVDERLPGGLAATCWAVQAGAQIIRTHDVKATLRAVRMTEEILEIRHRSA